MGEPKSFFVTWKFVLHECQQRILCHFITVTEISPQFSEKRALVVRFVWSSVWAAIECDVPRESCPFGKHIVYHYGECGW